MKRCAIKMWCLSGLLLVSLGLGSLAEAKDLTNRLGVGYNDQFHQELPSVQVRYYPNPKLGLSAALGIDTKEDESKFGFMVKLYRVIFMEDNMNFYMGTGAGIISVEEPKDGGTGTDNNSGFEVNGFVGGEFFFTGLDSLGFSFEAGVGVASISSEVRFRTIGDFPTRAGIIFYF